MIIPSSIFSQWELRVDGLPDWSVVDILDVAQDSTLLMYPTTSPLCLSKNFAKNWVTFDTPVSIHASDASLIDENNIWICTWDGKIFYSNNGGADWVTQYENTNNAFFNFIKFFDKDIGIVVGHKPS